MRIGIDVRYLSHGMMGGVHTYVRHFVPALIELAPEHQFFLYADQKRPFEIDQLPAHVTLRRLAWHSPVSTFWDDLYALRAAMARDALDVAHFPTNYGIGPRGVPTVITLHDAMTLLPLTHVLTSKGTPWTVRRVAMSVYLHIFSHVSLRNAAMVLTVSNHAKADILQHSHLCPAQVMPLPHAPTPDLRRVEDTAMLSALRERYGLRRPFVLADALKNPTALVRAWRRLAPELRERCEIVFFSRRPDPLPIVAEAVAEGIARLLVAPARADLVGLYSLAEAFVFPSWLEGFGIPILEAMTCGAPVICSDNSAMPEVAGDAGLLVHAEDDAMIAEHLTRLLSDPVAQQRQRALGFARAAQFSWRKTAQQMLAVYEQAALQPPPGYLAERSQHVSGR
jgi:glycosyltransferase involved in cell wall biosynthesis